MTLEHNTSNNIQSFIDKVYTLSWNNTFIELSALNEKQEKTSLQNLLNQILAKYTDEKDFDTKNKCIDLLFELGAEPQLDNHLWNVKTLFAHYEVIKKHLEQGDKVELAHLLLKRCFDYSILESSEEQALLVKLAFEYITDLDKKNYSFNIKVFHKALKNLKKAGLTKYQLLQLLYQTYVTTTPEKNKEEESEIQKEVVSYLLQEGIKTSELQFFQFELKLPTAKMLIDEYGVNPHILLLLEPETLSDYKKNLDMLEKYNIKITPFFILNLDDIEELDKEAMERTAKNLAFKVDDHIDTQQTIDDIAGLIPQIKEYLEYLSQTVDVYSLLKIEFAENGSVLHYLAKNQKTSFLEYILSSQTCNVNVVNDLGQTPLFYAASPQIADLLIKHGIDTDHKDHNHKTWVYTNPSITMIEYALEHKFITPKQTDDFLKLYLVEGNFEYAAIIAKKYFKSGLNLLHNLVQTIITGLEQSIENNKYQAIIHLMENAGITIPKQHQHLLKTFNDDTKEEDYNFIYGLVHKLAQHYINLVKKSFSRSIAEDSSNIKTLIDNAFQTLDFSTIKELYPDNKLLSQITDDFSAYTSVLSKASSLITNDLALEIMVLNGLRPAIVNFNESVNLYRGMKLDLSEDDMKSYFSYGHQAFVKSNSRHKLLGFNVNQPWNTIKNAHWEYGGTYFSLDPHTAAQFAAGMTTGNKVANSLLIESRFDNNIPKFCGSYTNEYEIITSNVPGNNIVALYTLKTIEDQGVKNYQVSAVIKNPYISDTISPRYTIGDNVTKDQEGMDLYKSLCQELPTKNQHSTLYKNTEDFVSRYTTERFIDDQKWLFNEYFSNRDMFEEECTIGNINLLDQCDL